MGTPLLTAFDRLKDFTRTSYNLLIVDILRQFRWSFLPPLLIYFAAGVSGLTAIVGTFFIKEFLGLSAAFLAGLSFWAGLPWAFKMPLGHLVDLLWQRKYVFVYFGAALISASLLIMYFLIAHREMMDAILPVEAWFVISTLLAPIGYVTQDSVADAMTVEAVPKIDEDGKPYAPSEIKNMHTTVQTLGRIALISGFVVVAAANIFIFDGVESLTSTQKADIYATVYLCALAIPLLSVSGVLLSAYNKRVQRFRLQQLGHDDSEIEQHLDDRDEITQPNYWILGGSAVFVAWTVLIGLTNLPFSQEIALIGSLSIVMFLIFKLIQDLDQTQAQVLIGTAIIIFVFRAVPLPGASVTWFEIDQLGFNQQFLAVLSLITSVLTLVGMIALRPLIANRSIAYLVALLSIMAGLLSLPNIGLYYGIHEWTSQWSGGIVDAHFIAILDTTIESPLGQIAMIPMLAWIAKNAPAHLKATFFAVMASFTNLALSTSNLLTKHLNTIFVVSREVKDPVTGQITTPADYSQLGLLLIVVAILVVVLPLLTILFVQNSRFRTQE